jgi:cell division protein FtsB
MRLGFQVVIAAAVVTMAFILVVPTARLYASQQEQKAALRAQVEAAQATNQDLEAQLKRWEDPAYVKAQARKRLSYVMPGERSYRVSDPENAPSVGPTPTPSAPPVHLDPTQPDGPDPWYKLLWDSAIVAGQSGG